MPEVSQEQGVSNEPRDTTKRFLQDLVSRGAEALGDVAIGEGLYFGTQFLAMKAWGLPDEQIRAALEVQAKSVMAIAIMPFFSVSTFRPVEAIKAVASVIRERRTNKGS